jgi:hypothetical protein
MTLLVAGSCAGPKEEAVRAATRGSTVVTAGSGAETTSGAALTHPAPSDAPHPVEAAAPRVGVMLHEDEIVLPSDWRVRSPRAFADYVAAFTAALGEAPVAPSAHEDLNEALGEPGTPATRAAVLLGHLVAHGDEVARDALIARLERRAVAPSRSEAAGDVVAAAALGVAPPPADLARRLAALAQGERPHPELDVRVECAMTALTARRDDVVPFLLAVLRAETPDQSRSPITWQRVTTLAWPKSRAADALATRAGMAKHDFRADASWQDQMSAANALEEALRGAGALE